MKIRGLVIATTAAATMLALVSAPASARTPSSPYSGKQMYVDPRSQAADLARRATGSDRRVLEALAAQPQAMWITDFRHVKRKARTIRRDVKRKGAYPTYVVYALPYRDCGGYSAGGATVPRYRSGITALAAALKKRRAAIILEPDGLASASCLTKHQRAQRFRLLRQAVSKLTRNPRLAVYLDIGHSQWRKPRRAAALLRHAGISKARGFSLNVANFQRTKAEIRYGRAISRRVGDKTFVIDTSRNGRGAPHRSTPEGWCNPTGRAIGALPSARTRSHLVDAYLWVKRPGESDGTCRGGPPSGRWFHARALEMVKNRWADQGR